ncbi:MAG: LCP family protein [Finegoldia magna]|uniref:LCP family protein n=1 Tax=Finegoldia magna TaxID=1260 RepID=UPI0029079EA2|nr:LCP family protein [Finegoldia magna]MDU7330945.1 LCP family protein [Finegoldia magna]
MKNKVLASVLGIISLIAAAFFSYNLLSNKLLPSKYQIIIIAGFVLLTLLVVLLVSRKSIVAKTIGIILFSIIIATTITGTFYINKSMKALEKVSNTESIKQTKVKLSLVKLKSSNLEELSKKDDLVTQVYEKENKTDINTFVDEIKGKINKNLKTTDVNSYMLAAKNLITKKTDFIVLNEAYRSVIKDFIPEFDDLTEVVGDKEFTRINKLSNKVEDKSSFNLYISGIDTYGPIETVSRSDVNLIVSVNQKTRKILITTIPRDTYVPIAGGGNDQKDKLTHAGIYGIDSSIKTLENFLDTKIDYYAKVNFNTLIEVVDVLGGVDVDNVQTFSAGGYNFPKGKVHLDGKKALVFSRERYHLADGDHDRGRNQERVLKAIIEKASRPESLLKTSPILSIAEKSAQTNMSKDFMVQMINKEIDEPKGYEIESQDLKGTGKMGLPSYAMPGYRLYMMESNEDSLKEVKNKIENNLKVN